MDQLNNYADNRLINGCIFCGGPEETRDHVPSRVFLDSPLPENLPVVAACSLCNQGFSLDEEYVACLIESVIADSVEPDRIRRLGVANILRRAPALRARVGAARYVVDGQIHYHVEQARMRNVLLKLARGHAAFELGQMCREEPAALWWSVFPLLPQEEKDEFDAAHVTEMIGEVGSRGLQRLLVTQLALISPSGEKSVTNLAITDWVDVQDERYRYLAVDDTDGITVKIVIAEYLACKVAWRR